MPRIEEPRLKADLKAGNIARTYFLFGEEDYLVRMYAERIAAVVAPEAREMNFMKFSGAPSLDALSDFTDSLPFFSERKCVMITDLEPDPLEMSQVNGYCSIIEDIPETTVLIIAQINLEIDPKKAKARMKKIMAAAEKSGCVCELKHLSPSQISSMAQKKAARAGCVLSAENGALLAEMCGRSLSNVAHEVEKLCAYKAGGEITREDIDKLTPKPTDVNIYDLASELLTGHTDKAFRLLDDLFASRVEPVVILAALSGHFTDLYRAKLGLIAKKNASDTAAAFGYPSNRAFVVRKAYGSAGRLSEEYLGDCLDILYHTNAMLNSSKEDKRTLIETALTEIAALGGSR